MFCIESNLYSGLIYFLFIVVVSLGTGITSLYLLTQFIAPFSIVPSCRVFFRFKAIFCCFM
jgi:hypothetical protein